MSHMKAKTPEQLAQKPVGKDKFTLYLSIKSMTAIKQHADKVGISASLIVDEAIANYLHSIKDK